MRQRWGASIINFFQEVKLAEGSYHLSADLFATDNSSNNTATVYVGGITRSVTATNQWQTVTIDFEADGNNPITIGAKADHKSNEFICAFDNFVLTKEEPVGIKSMDKGQGSRDNDQWYDLSGRRIANSSIKPGIYIINDKKVNITK
jgi:hypothetical protein